MAPAADLARRAVAECLGTLLLVATVVGSGIMAERLGAPVALALLANTLATGAVLIALIASLGPLSGAYFNPAVTAALAALGRARWREVPVYIAAQVTGALLGTSVAHAMFELPWFSASQHARTGAAQWTGEFVATFGLLTVIAGTARSQLAAFAVAAWIVAAYWFTSSTSFANPAVTLARAVSDTFAGIRPADAPAFMVVQLLGALLAAILWRWLVPAGRAQEEA